MKKKTEMGMVLAAVLVIAAAIGFFGKGAAENINPKRISTWWLEKEGIDYKVDAEKNAEASLGSEDNPFVILEIIPEEKEGMAEAGYLVPGCEPVKIRTFESKDNVKELSRLNSSLFGFTDKVFLEEWEADSFPDSWVKVENQPAILFGYYERVEDGEGDFIWEEKTEWMYGIERQIFRRPKPPEKDKEPEKGNWVWHTTENYDAADEAKVARQRARIRECAAAEKIGKEKEQDNPENINKNKRIYNYRTDSGYYVSEESCLYSHYDDFLRTSLLLLDRETREDFCVCVKTVTAKKLNEIYEKEDIRKEEDWIQAADLIYVYSKKGAKDYDGEKDFSWNTVMAVMKRVAADAVPAAFWADTHILEAEYTPADTRKNIVSYHGFDWEGNYRPELNRGGTGSRNNLYKLGIMLTRWDARFFYSFFIQGSTEEGGFGGKWIDENGNLFADENRHGEYLNEEEKIYWGKGSFLPVGGDAQKLWEKYHLDLGSDQISLSYVYKNVLFYDTNDETTSLVNGALTKPIEKDRFSKDFFEEMEISGSTTMNGFLGMQYILNAVAKDTVKRERIRVLDLEPCNDFSDLTEAWIRMLLRDIKAEADKIEVVRQTTAEFIGRREELDTAYDLIYLGLNDGALYKTNGKTDYNDHENYGLDGSIYLHTGDSVSLGDAAAKEYPQSWAGEGVKRFRLPGNDITARKKKELMEYVEEGHPVIAASAFKTMDNDKTVDSSSHIYDFVKENKSLENWFWEDDTEKINKRLTECLRKQSLEIELTEAPMEYRQTGEEKGTYLKPDASGSYQLNYRCRLKGGKSSKNYLVTLYLDGNGDGKFAEEERYQSAEMTGSVKEFTLRAELSSEWFGVIPWKLEVAEKAGTEKDTIEKTAVTGICAAEKPEDVEKRKINVLQVMQTERPGAENKKNSLDLQEEKIGELIANLQDYEIRITGMNIEEFEAVFETGSGKGKSNFPTKNTAVTVVKDSVPSANESIVSLSDIDMLVFGFAHEYENISKKNGALLWVKDYIESGKSVLFTHDTTSLYNVPYRKNTTAVSEDDHAVNGYNFNQYFRGILGMDRFDILYQIHKDETDVRKKVESAGTTDQAWVFHNKTKVYKEQQGFTYYAAMKLAGGTGQKLTLNGLKPENTEERYGETTQAEKVNDGQISRYPYYIEDSFKTAETHAQYYQLNMEDEDIVVWYTLKEDAAKWSALYGQSPRDTSNNYYIYSKGNVTYANIGHSDSGVNIEEKGLNERKLLVNTIIAASRPEEEKPEQPPVLEFPELEPEGETEEAMHYSGYLDFDYTSKYEDYSQGEGWVAFVPLAKGEGDVELSVGIYPLLKEGSKGELCRIKDSEGRLLGEDKKTTIAAEPGEMAEGWMLESGKVYYAQCSWEKYEEETPPEFLFVIEAKRKKEPGLSKVLRGKNAVVRLKRRELFSLD